MIEYYIAMFIFLILILSIGYFMYRWYETFKKINFTNLNLTEGLGGENNSNLIAAASLHQPCVLLTEDTLNNTANPTCDSSSGLTCVTDMYIGNGANSGTGVCLSGVGGYCNTIYDCVPSAQACVNSVCENMTETINLPCTYDSDCIGGATCTYCSNGIGPCKNTITGECSELVNGECPHDLSVCNKQIDKVLPVSNLQGEFRFNHICDTSLAIPLCKYDLSPKDQGCTSDTDCVQPEGGALCYTGKFKTDADPTGTLSAPEYTVLSTKIASDNSIIINIDFGDSLVTVDSFEQGTEVNFIKTDTTRTTISYGPYYINEQFDNSYISLMGNKFQPEILEYVLFPPKYIQLNKNSYYESAPLDSDDISPVLVEDAVNIRSTVTITGGIYTITGNQPSPPFTSGEPVTVTSTSRPTITETSTIKETNYSITGSQPSPPFTSDENVKITSISRPTVTSTSTVSLSGGNYSITGSQPSPPFTSGENVTVISTLRTTVKSTSQIETNYSITGSQSPNPFNPDENVTITSTTKPTLTANSTVSLSEGNYTITGSQPVPPSNKFTNNQPVTITYISGNTNTQLHSTITIPQDTDTYTITGNQPQQRFTNNQSVTIQTSDYHIVFGKLPPLQIISKCYWDTTNSHFTIVDTDTNFSLIDATNVNIGKTEVRFDIANDNFQKSRQYTLSGIKNTGKSFTVTGNTDSLIYYNTSTNTINVQFGMETDLEILNETKGVCVMKLPPSASISRDSKYDLTDYIGNPCIDLYDNSVVVESTGGYCKFTNTQSGPGSVCQFSRPSVDVENGEANPLPCSSSTSSYEGITYELECLFNDNLTETVRNNPNFLNSSYAGICAYPVHNKFKSCELYNFNCITPYVCTEFQGGFFCDSRFDILQCNTSYGCPPDYQCSDGVCLGSPGTGLCVAEGNCSSQTSCDISPLFLGFYNSTLDTKTTVVASQVVNKTPNQIITFENTMLSGLTGSAKDYDLYVSSSYGNDNKLTTYAFVYNNTSKQSKLIKIEDPLGTPILTTLKQPTDFYDKFIWDDVTNILYTYSISGKNINIVSIYDPSGSSFNNGYHTTGADIQKIDINNNKLLITSSNPIPSDSPIPPGRPIFINTDINETNFLLFQTIGDGVFYKSDGTNLKNVDKGGPVVYYTSMPSPTPSQNYIVNNLTDTKDNGYYAGGTKTEPGTSETKVYIVQGNETSYYIFNTTTSTFDSYQLKSVTLQTTGATIPSGDYINPSHNVWYSGGTTNPNTIPTVETPANQQKNEYIVDLYDINDNSTKKSYTLPYSPDELDSLDVCKFDLLNVNDTELDIVCVYNPENFESPTLGVRHKVRELDVGKFTSLGDISGLCTPSAESTNTLGCFLNPTISSLTYITTPPTVIQSATLSTLYQVTNPVDVNTIYAFSNQIMTLTTSASQPQTVKKIYKSKSTLYLELSGSLGTQPIIPAPATPPLSENIPTITDVTLTTIPTGGYAPFSFTSSSNLDNYGNVMSTYLQYPYWIEDLQDLIVGDSFNPKIERIFYQPDRVNRNFYAIVDMYTGYNNPIENKLIEEISDIQTNNMYLFKFSSLNNEIGLTVNETIPIRLDGPSDIKRFSQCNQTQNMFFLTNKCSP